MLDEDYATQVPGLGSSCLSAVRRRESASPSPVGTPTKPRGAAGMLRRPTLQLSPSVLRGRALSGDGPGLPLPPTRSRSAPQRPSGDSGAGAASSVPTQDGPQLPPRRGRDAKSKRDPPRRALTPKAGVFRNGMDLGRMLADSLARAEDADVRDRLSTPRGASEGAAPAASAMPPRVPATLASATETTGGSSSRSSAPGSERDQRQPSAPGAATADVRGRQDASAPAEASAPSRRRDASTSPLTRTKSRAASPPKGSAASSPAKPTRRGGAAVPRRDASCGNSPATPNRRQRTPSRTPSRPSSRPASRDPSPAPSPHGSAPAPLPLRSPNAPAPVEATTAPATRTVNVVPEGVTEPSTPPRAAVVGGSRESAPRSPSADCTLSPMSPPRASGAAVSTMFRVVTHEARHCAAEDDVGTARTMDTAASATSSQRARRTPIMSPALDEPPPRKGARDETSSDNPARPPAARIRQPAGLVSSAAPSPGGAAPRGAQPSAAVHPATHVSVEQVSTAWTANASAASEGSTFGGELRAAVADMHEALDMLRVACAQYDELCALVYAQRSSSSASRGGGERRRDTRVLLITWARTVTDLDVRARGAALAVDAALSGGHRRSRDDAVTEAEEEATAEQYERALKRVLEATGALLALESEFRRECVALSMDVDAARTPRAASAAQSRSASARTSHERDDAASRTRSSSGPEDVHRSQPRSDRRHQRSSHASVDAEEAPSQPATPAKQEAARAPQRDGRERAPVATATATGLHSTDAFETAPASAVASSATSSAAGRAATGSNVATSRAALPVERRAVAVGTEVEPAVDAEIQSRRIVVNAIPIPDGVVDASCAVSAATSYHTTLAPATARAHVDAAHATVGHARHVELSRRHQLSLLRRHLTTATTDHAGAAAWSARYEHERVAARGVSATHRSSHPWAGANAGQTAAAATTSAASRVRHAWEAATTYESAGPSPDTSFGDPVAVALRGGARGVALGHTAAGGHHHYELHSPPPAHHRPRNSHHGTQADAPCSGSPGSAAPYAGNGAGPTQPEPFDLLTMRSSARCQRHVRALYGPRPRGGHGSDGSSAGGTASGFGKENRPRSSGTRSTSGGGGGGRDRCGSSSSPATRRAWDSSPNPRSHHHVPELNGTGVASAAAARARQQRLAAVRSRLDFGPAEQSARNAHLIESHRPAGRAASPKRQASPLQLAGLRDTRRRRVPPPVASADGRGVDPTRWTS